MATIQTRKRKNGKIVYRVMIRRIDAAPVYKTFALKHDAMKFATQADDEISQGTFGLRHEAQKHTLTDAIERYIRVELPKKPKAIYNVTQHLVYWKAQLGDKKLSELTSALIVELRDTLAAGTTVRGRQRAPATVNRYLATLSHVLSVACREWEWLESSPMQRVRKLKEPRGRVRYLSDDERKALLKACEKWEDPYLYTIVILALSTGMRRGEIMSLTWGDVDLERHRIVLQQTKNGERRLVPLVGKAHELLLAHATTRCLGATLLWPSENEGYTHQPKDMRKAWEAALEAAKLEDFHFHDLRHSAASYLAMSGATTSEIAEVLGHKTLTMVKRYSHLSDSHVSQVVERMNARFVDDQSHTSAS